MRTFALFTRRRPGLMPEVARVIQKPIPLPVDQCIHQPLCPPRPVTVHDQDHQLCRNVNHCWHPRFTHSNQCTPPGSFFVAIVVSITRGWYYFRACRSTFPAHCLCVGPVGLCLPSVWPWSQRAGAGACAVPCTSLLPEVRSFARHRPPPGARSSRTVPWGTNK